jgi:hypothetical protein
VQPADVLASTRPDRVTVGCLGRHWELALSTAAQWIGAIGYDPDGLVGIFPGGVGDDDLDALWECSRQLLVQPGRTDESESGDRGHEMVRTQRDHLHHQDFERKWVNSARVAVARGSGRDWWWTVNLVRKVLGIWPYINGQLLLSGVNAETMRFPLWCDAAFMLLWNAQDQDGRTRLEMELSMPPAGVHVQISSAANRKMLDRFAAD